MEHLFSEVCNFDLRTLTAWAVWSLLFFVLKRKLRLAFGFRKKSSDKDAKYYDYLKFKYEQKLQYRLEKYRINHAGETESKTTDGKSVPWYIRVIK